MRAICRIGLFVAALAVAPVAANAGALEGAAIGAGAGAVVGGPVGAVVGGGVGAVVGGPNIVSNRRIYARGYQRCWLDRQGYRHCRYR
jgi:uncharacterized protein YcfJ